MRFTHRGVDVVARHLARFDPDPANSGMLARLRAIAYGALTPTPWDTSFYAHELREFVRYQRRGWADGVPASFEARHALWNDTHTATLEDYRLADRDRDDLPLYHPDHRSRL